MIDHESKKRIESAVKSAEEKTSGEIVPVILKSSDFYPAAHFRLALIVGLLCSITCYYFFDWDDAHTLITANIVGIVVGYLLGFIGAIKRKFILKSEKAEEVHQKALEVFYHSNVSMTKERSGVLILVSLLERRVEVLADCGINEKVPENYWDDLVNELTSSIIRGKFIEGMESAVKNCGNKLNEFFPIQENDTNELDNKLITDL